MATSMILSSVYIGLNNFFSGLIVRPQYMEGLFEITYWITPGHYVYEGMITALYHNDTRIVFADSGSEFYVDIDCAGRNLTEGAVCEGSVHEYMVSFFGGKFSHDHGARNLLILGGILALARVITFLALHYINFSAT